MLPVVVTDLGVVPAGNGDPVTIIKALVIGSRKPGKMRGAQCG